VRSGRMASRQCKNFITDSRCILRASGYELVPHELLQVGAHHALQSLIFAHPLELHTDFDQEAVSDYNDMNQMSFACEVTDTKRTRPL
jgi:hypothetical protein